MNPQQPPGDPRHGVTLERMLGELVAHFGWDALGERISIRCFTSDPSVPSSLRFLRKTPWAREKVEGLYLSMLRRRAQAVGSKERESISAGSSRAGRKDVRSPRKPG